MADADGWSVDKKEYCRSFLRNWCHAADDSTFRVVAGRCRPRRIVEEGGEVVVVGILWLEANAIPAEFLEEDRG